MLSLSSTFPLRKLSVLKAAGSKARPQSTYERSRGKRRNQQTPLRKTFPIFQIPDHVLDLDAEGAKGVRPFDEQLEIPALASFERDRKLEIARQRVADFESRYHANESKFKAILLDPFSPKHIEDVDILVVALSRTTRPPGRDRRADYTLRKVLDNNGVPEFIRASPVATMEFMLQRQWQLRDLSPKTGDRTLLDEALSACETFHELERVVARTTRTQRGCKLLSQLGEKLTQHVKRVMKSHPKSLAIFDRLGFFNNLLISMDLYGVQMSSDVLQYAFSVAIMCKNYSTAQQYLARLLEQGSSLPNSLINRVLLDMSTSTKHTLQSSLTLFSLLTGYVPGEEHPRASIRSLIDQENPRTFSVYIKCLVNMRAFRTLWHELSGAPAADWTKKPAQESQFDSTRRNYIANVATRVRNTRVTGDFETDCQLDMAYISEALRYKTGRGQTKRVSVRRVGVSRRNESVPDAAKPPAPAETKGTRGRRKPRAAAQKVKQSKKRAVHVKRPTGSLPARKGKARIRFLARSIHPGSLYL
ncbi:hypothetical protein F5Y17DRAFT_441060 [Xylariaceae sp. FL0594]|nr:hypothetical protein F5Y17DRAFT_441060 [Xylariaceae sp. FL0594]